MYLRKIALLTWLIFPIISYSQGYTIKGKIDGLACGTKLYLVHALDKYADTVSTSTVQNEGIFQFKGRLPLEGEWHYIKCENYKEYISLFLNNATIIIQGKIADWPKVSIKGSRSHNDYLAFNEKIAGMNKERNQLKQNVVNVTDSISLKTNNDALIIIQQEIKEEWERYISTHPRSLYTPFLILQSNYTIAEQQQFFNYLDTVARQSYYGQELREKISHIQGYSKIKVGAVAPDFKSITPDGRIISLKEIAARSKITLVDFWASWCKPCRAETPALKIAYQQLREQGFNILSISLDFDKAQWQQAIANDGMTWLHVSQLRYREEDAAKIYGINGIPAQFIIDEHMKILAIDLPGSPVLSSGSLRGQERLDFITKALSDSELL